MPELPEVQTVVNSLVPAIVGRKFASIEVCRADVVSPAGFDLAGHLNGRTVAKIARRAKRIVFTLDDDESFYIHLGMSGRLTLAALNETPAKHTHVIFHGQDFTLHFRDPRRFGGIFWLPAGATDEIGPEPLQVKIGEFARRLGRTRRPIKNALLDQKLIAGLGNIYVDESLFAAGIHPLTPANSMLDSEMLTLLRGIRRVLRKALLHRGSTLRDYVDAAGGAGAFQKLHNVYDRAEQPCRRCRNTIRRIKLGGRSTHFCPECQPARLAAPTPGRSR